MPSFSAAKWKKATLVDRVSRVGRIIVHWNNSVHTQVGYGVVGLYENLLRRCLLTLWINNGRRWLNLCDVANQRLIQVLINWIVEIEKPSTISNGTNGSTLGRTTSFRMGNRPGQQPAAASNSGADQSMKNKIATGYTSALINLTRPFRKSREENEKVKGRDFDADSLSPDSSHQSLNSAGINSNPNSQVTDFRKQIVWAGIQVRLRTLFKLKITDSLSIVQSSFKNCSLALKQLYHSSFGPTSIWPAVDPQIARVCDQQLRLIDSDAKVETYSFRLVKFSLTWTRINRQISNEFDKSWKIHLPTVRWVMYLLGYVLVC